MVACIACQVTERSSGRHALLDVIREVRGVSAKAHVCNLSPMQRLMCHFLPQWSSSVFCYQQSTAVAALAGKATIDLLTSWHFRRSVI